MIPREIFPKQAVRMLAVSVGVAAAALFSAPAIAADTEDNGGVGNGNQVEAPVQAPIEIRCNAIGVLGDAKAECPEGKDKPKPEKTKPPKTPPSTPPASTPPVEKTPPAKPPADKALPVTGGAVTSLLLAGAAVVGAGGALLVAARRRAVQN